MRRVSLLALCVAAALAASACGGDDGGSGGSAGSADDTAPRGLAAIHTVDALEPLVQGLADAYNANSDAPVSVKVVAPEQAIQAVTTGNAGILPAAWMTTLDAESTAIGRNLAVIAVPTGNPSQVSGLDAFADDSGLDTAVCGPDSPYGNLAADILMRAAVQLDPAQVGTDCGADAVARVAGGELDAALTFRAFVPIPPEVELVDVPEAQNIVLDIRYSPASGTPTSGSFEEFLTSDAAAQVLSESGFLP
jgi:molybdate transport system substrate-binding protein